MLRLGYDAHALFNNFTGPGNYSRTLLKNLTDYFPDHIYFLYATEVERNAETQFFLNSALYHLQLPRYRPAVLWSLLGLQRELRRHRVAIFHGLNAYLPPGLGRMGIRRVVTVHDLAFQRYPQFYSWEERLRRSRRIGQACRRADRIVAISECTRRDLVELYGVDPARIVVVYQSVHERYLTEKPPKVRRAVGERHHLPGEYLLYVGAVSRRKNLLAAVQALETLPAADRLPLVVVGRSGTYRDEIVDYARARGLAALLHFIRPDFDELPAIYQKAAAFIYPSLYEGFGIPVLEALFSRIPVITSNTSSLPEAGGDAACLVDPTDPAAIGAALQRVLQDSSLRQSMIERGWRHAQQFRGNPLTQRMMEVYEALQ